MGDKVPNPTPLGNLKTNLRTQNKRTSELERPTGSQYAQNLQKITSLIAGLNQQVADAIAANSYTKSQLDSMFNGKLDTDGSIDQSQVQNTWTKSVNTGGSVTASGTVSSSGNVTAGADLKAAGTLYAAGAPGYNITGTRVAGWWQSADGRAGTASSSERYKTDVAAVMDLDPQKILQAQVVYYHYIAELTEQARRAALDPEDPEYTDKYPVHLEIGMIAERLHELGLWQFVVYQRDDLGCLIPDDEGNPVPEGIHYANWALAEHIVNQYQEKRLDDLEARLAKAGL